MHWETDRMRSSVSKIIDQQSHRQLNKQRNHDLEQKRSRIRDRAVLGKETRIRHDDEDLTYPTHVSGEPKDGINQSHCGCHGENESRFSWRHRGRRGLKMSIGNG